MTGLLLLTAFAAGAFGSAHCLGMCGPLVIVLEGGSPSDGRWLRRFAYNAGRLGFYAGLGAVAGAGGTMFARLPMGGVVLRCIAAGLVMAMGLQLATRWQPLRALERVGGSLWQRLTPLTRHVLPANTLPRAVAAGLLWGAVPCGLVYSALALAASSGNAPAGAAIMLAFWAGTLPALLLAGRAAASLGTWQQHPRTRRLAGIAMLVSGAVALYMPLAHIAQGHASSPGQQAEAPHGQH